MLRAGPERWSSVEREKGGDCEQGTVSKRLRSSAMGILVLCNEFRKERCFRGDELRQWRIQAEEQAYHPSVPGKRF